MFKLWIARNEDLRLLIFPCKPNVNLNKITGAYIGIEWALKQNEEIKKLIEDNDYDKGYQDAIEKAKQIIISFMPLPSPQNHNINSNLNLLKEREKYAKQVAMKFEEMMLSNERGNV